jgi:hypothetical protein
MGEKKRKCVSDKFEFDDLENCLGTVKMNWKFIG